MGDSRGHKYTSLLTPGRQMAINRHQERTVSGVSIPSRAVSEFLEGRIVELTSQRDALLEHREGLLESRHIFSAESFQRELESVVNQIAHKARDLGTLRGSKHVIEQDMEEGIENEGCKRLRDHEPSADFLERAYANSLVPRVMGASTKQVKEKFTKHDQAVFRENVLKYYGALDEDIAWCHITGYWLSKELIKAAHLVPKALTNQEISFLFGANEVVSKNPRNGLSLHKVIEAGLDSGKIVIVPVLRSDEELTCWKCVLVDQNCRNDTAFRVGGRRPVTVYWRDIDQRQLEFRTPNRPARRFLYFRFLITYLHAKGTGNDSFTRSVESRKKFWASAGQYLHSSTLKSLARNISGLELPASLTSNTFNDPSLPEVETESVSATLAADLRQASIESIKKWNERNQDDDNDEDSEDSEDSEESNVISTASGALPPSQSLIHSLLD